MSPHREVERTLDVDRGTVLPDLAGLPGVASVDEPVTHVLEATYHDTAELDLVRQRTTLRRRTGGDDAGWHLKVPSDDGERDEHHAPLGATTDAAPEELVRRVADLTRGRALVPVVALRTERTVHRLRDAGGTALAEVCDDRVSATALRTGTDRAWREWEVELVEGGTDLLDAAVALLRGAGAREAAVTSKLARALGDELPDRPRAR
ncbi:hypothetical protein GCM10027047_25610 [Rhodococcus aerolatus]